MFNIKRSKFFSKGKFGAFLGIAAISLLLPGFAHAADYKVVKGDSLFTIGKMFNTTAGELANRNNLSKSEIYPGQVLNVPANSYTVKSGDTLYFIAKRYGIPFEKMKRANHEWDNYLYPGQKLVLPGIVSGQKQPAGSGTATAPKPTSAVISYSASDLDLLARLVTAEAESEPYAAQVGVAAVVINRVKDDGFANSIRSVIYEVSGGFYQFTPVENGWINRPATETAKKAAYEALHGSDPSKGALFYFDDSATNKWLWSKPLAARIGKMVFVY